LLVVVLQLLEQEEAPYQAPFAVACKYIPAEPSDNTQVEPEEEIQAAAVGEAGHIQVVDEAHSLLAVQRVAVAADNPLIPDTHDEEQEGPYRLVHLYLDPHTYQEDTLGISSAPAAVVI